MKKLLQKIKGKFSVAMMAMTALMAFAAVGASASTGTEIDFSTTNGFGVDLMDIINTAWNFLGQFDTFTTLILAVIMVPTLIGFIIWLVSKMPKFRKSNS